MSWGATLLGFNGVMNALDDIQTRITDDVVYVVGTNVEYAIYQEFGTSKMSAQPFLFPAAREAERDPASYVRKHHPKLSSLSDAESMSGIVGAVALAIERDAAERAPVDTGTLMNSLSAERVR